MVTPVIQAPEHSRHGPYVDSCGCGDTGREATPRVGEPGAARYHLLRSHGIHRAAGIVPFIAARPSGELFPFVADGVGPPDNFLFHSSRTGVAADSRVAAGGPGDPR